MKSVAFGTAGLVFVLCRPLLADAPASDHRSVIQNSVNLSNPTVVLPPSGLDSKHTDESFLVVDKSGADLTDGLSAGSDGLQRANRLSEESSGRPADTSGVPMPRAGWISFIGLLGVIAARQYSQSRRRARTLMN